jgi:hypothetical protein
MIGARSTPGYSACNKVSPRRGSAVAGRSSPIATVPPEKRIARPAVRGAADRRPWPRPCRPPRRRRARPWSAHSARRARWRGVRPPYRTRCARPRRCVSARKAGSVAERRGLRKSNPKDVTRTGQAVPDQGPAAAGACGRPGRVSTSPVRATRSSSAGLPAHAGTTAAKGCPITVAPPFVSTPSPGRTQKATEGGVHGLDDVLGARHRGHRERHGLHQGAAEVQEGGPFHGISVAGGPFAGRVLTSHDCPYSWGVACRPARGRADAAGPVRTGVPVTRPR